MSRWRTVLPWVLFGVVLVLLSATAVAAEVLKGRVPTETAGFDGWLGYVWLSSWLGFPLVGAVIASRRRTVIGWLLILIGLSITAAVASSAFLIYEVHVAGRVPGALLLAAVSAAPAPAFGLAPFAIDRFPTDEGAMGRWRLVVRAAAVVLAVTVLALAIRPTIIDDQGTTFANPLAVDALGTAPDAIVAVGGFLLGAFFVAVVIRTVVRFRRATGVRRAQLKWFVSSLCVFPMLFAVIFLGSGLPQAVIDVIVAVAFFTSFNGMAAAMGIAILRYRLFEIDRVVSRTVTYVAISAVLLAVYLGGILISQTVLGPFTGGSDLGVALSTLVAAALFQPVRRRVQSLVDRRFNRARYDAQRTVDAFSATVRDEVELAGVVADLRRATVSTVEPRDVTVWLREVPS